MSSLAKSSLAMAVLVAQAVSAETLTLRDAVREALARNPAIAAARAQNAAAEAREKEARAGRIPRVDLSESVSRGNNPVFVFGSLLEQGEFAPRHFDAGFLNAPPALTNFRAALSARYPVFDRFRTETAIRQSRNGVVRTSAGNAEARQQIVAATVARYYGVAVAEEKLAVARAAVLSAEAAAKATRDRFEQGLIVESDALSADVQLAGFRQRAIAAAGEVAVARAALATLLQRPRAEELTVSAALPDVRTETADLNAAVGRAVEQRAPVRAASTMTADAELRLRAERGAALPRVDAFGTFGASGATLGSRNADHIGGLAITLELFDRARPARVAAARAEIDAARAGEAMARDAVTMEVIQAWHRLNAARESAAVAATAARQAEAAARIVHDRYESGLTTITEQLRAQTALVSAQFELLAARYESLVAHADLLRATGDLHDVDPFL